MIWETDVQRDLRCSVLLHNLQFQVLNLTSYTQLLISSILPRSGVIGYGRIRSVLSHCESVKVNTHDEGKLTKRKRQQQFNIFKVTQGIKGVAQICKNFHIRAINILTRFSVMQYLVFVRSR